MRKWNVLAQDTLKNPLSFVFILFNCRVNFSLFQLHDGKKSHQPNVLSLPLLYLKDSQMKLKFFGLNLKGLKGLPGQVPRQPLSITWAGKLGQMAQICLPGAQPV